MAECNTCGGYLSIEDKIRLSMKCDANGNVVWQGALLNYSEEQIYSLLGDKMAYWGNASTENEDYFVNKIGMQDRIALSGLNHPGRAIEYDATIPNYSQSNDNTPNNLRLVNNSISIFFRIKIDSLPSSYINIIGTASGISNGSYSIYINNKTGHINALIRSSNGPTVISSNQYICDGDWHSVLVIINKTGLFSIYLDNILRVSEDISAFTFNNLASKLTIGHNNVSVSGSFQIRDIKIYDRAVIDALNNIHKDEIVEGCIAWYLCEGNKENDVYMLIDSVSNNHLLNFGFTESSLVSGAWESLLNKYGYANDYESPDLFNGEGNFNDSTKFTASAAYFTIAGGQINYNAVEDGAFWNLTTLNVPKNSVIKVSFDVISENSATLFVCSQVSTALNVVNTYVKGSHTLIFKTLAVAQNVGLRCIAAGGAFTLDNFTVAYYDEGIISPKLNVSYPVNDFWGRELVFKGQAKYNLYKAGSGVKLDDYVGEMFDAAKDINVADWYDGDGIANTIATASLSYQTGKQYYNADNKELIIIKAKTFISLAEDAILRKYMSIDDEPSEYRAGITLTLDDTWHAGNWVEADAMFKEYGWKCNFAICTSHTNTTDAEDIAELNSYKTHLDALIAAGHEMCNHAIRHQSYAAYIDLGKTNQEFFDERIAPMRVAIETVLGYTTVSYHYGSWFGQAPEMSALILSNGFTTVRETANSYPVDIKNICYDGTNQILYSVDLVSNLGEPFTDMQITNLLEYARNNNLIVNLVTHKISDDGGARSLTISKMRLICEFIKKNNMKWYLMRELSADLF